MKFNDVFKKLRLSKGMSQDELANALDISRSAIGMYEQGKRTPDYETLELIADYFNVDMNTLLGKNTTPNDPATIEIIEQIKKMDEKHLVMLLSYIKFLNADMND